VILKNEKGIYGLLKRAFDIGYQLMETKLIKKIVSGLVVKMLKGSH